MEDVVIVFIILLFVCLCASSMSGVTWWSMKGENRSPIDFSRLSDFNFSEFSFQNVINPPTTRTTPFNFVKYTDFTVGDFANIGTNQTGKTTDECNILCSSTPGCTGFVSDNNNCQLKNNVVLLERSKGSSIYASGDIGGVRYLQTNFNPILAPGTQPLWSLSGSVGDAVSNCFKNKDTCSGFSFDNNQATMYGPGSIVGLDSTSSGTTYTDINNRAKFVLEGNYRYSEQPDKTWQINQSWAFPYQGGQVVLPKNDGDFFATWNSNWDAGLDAFSKRNPQSVNANTITVNNLQQCQNACVANLWCESFVYSDSAKTCYMRHDAVAEHFPLSCKSQASARACSDGVVGCGCPCGCAGQNNAHDGTNDNTKTSYVKRQYPINITCPMSCNQDTDCKMVTFSGQSCNQYNSIPTRRQADSNFTSVWNIDNFPR